VPNAPPPPIPESPVNNYVSSVGIVALWSPDVFFTRMFSSFQTNGSDDLWEVEDIVLEKVLTLCTCSCCRYIT